MSALSAPSLSPHTPSMFLLFFSCSVLTGGSNLQQMDTCKLSCTRHALVEISFINERKRKGSACKGYSLNDTSCASNQDIAYPFFLKEALFRNACLNSRAGQSTSPFSFYTQVRWLSKGNVLRHVFEMREEIQLFLDTKNYI